MARIAFVSDELPFPETAGHRRMNGAVLRACQGAGHEVCVVLTRPRLASVVPRLPGTGMQLRSPGVVRLGNRAVLVEPRELTGMAWRRLRGVLGLRARAGRAVLGAEPPDADARRAADAILAFGPDLVLVDTLFRMKVVRALGRPRPRIAVLTHDLFHERHRSLAAAGLRLSPASLGPADEAALLAGADLLVAITAADADGFARLLPGTPRLVAAAPALPMPRPASVEREPGRVVFLGSKGAHNRDALGWLLQTIWPLVRARAPHAVLDVVGSVGEEVPRGTPGVVVHGVVADLAPLLHRASVAVAPLRAGSGLKIKILDYLAHGLPVVATPVALAGFEPCEALRAAGDAAGFADQVVALLGPAPQEAASLEASALAAASRCGEAESLGALLSWIDGVAPARPALPQPTRFGAVPGTA